MDIVETDNAVEQKIARIARMIVSAKLLFRHLILLFLLLSITSMERKLDFVFF